MMKEYDLMNKIPGQLMRDKMPFDPKIIVAGAANAGQAAMSAGKILAEGAKKSQQ